MMEGDGSPSKAQPVSQELRSRFCNLPWLLAELHGNGSVYVCCPRYSGGKAIGNFFRQSFQEVWNSDMAIAFRRGILDGNFAQCSKTLCPSIAGLDLPFRSSLKGKEKEWVEQDITKLNKGPAVVKMVHDDSCNLACPSCRDRILVAKKDRQLELDRMLETFLLPFLKDCETLTLSGDGDPFASKHYRDILIRTAENSPSMKINLHTNAVLCDERAWNELKLGGRTQAVLVSIDAASEATYNITRRGGDWKRLLDNLAFLQRLKLAGQIRWLDLAFVVQSANFSEIGEFVRLGKGFGASSVSFSFIEYWSRTGSRESYNAQRVFDGDHPAHQDFLRTLSDPVLDDPIVKLGELRLIRNRHLERQV